MSGRCYCCNKKLSEYELTLRNANTGDFVDTCVRCLDGLGIPLIGRDDLDMFEDVSDDVQDSREEDDEY